MVTDIAGAGTTEATWQHWSALHTFPPLDLSGCGRLVVLAPHPDDEVLGVGGLLATAGVEVLVVAVTDGDASHPGSPTHGAMELASLRRAEQVEALHTLGIHTRITRLGLPDGHIVDDDVAVAAGQLLRPGDWCLSTWDGDGHPDHEAVGRAAARACRDIGVRLLQFPIWTWHWSHPADPRVPWHRARSVALGPAVLAAKRAAIACYRSQVQPLSDDLRDAAILTAPTVDRLTRSQEVVFG